MPGAPGCAPLLHTHRPTIETPLRAPQTDTAAATPRQTIANADHLDRNNMDDAPRPTSTRDTPTANRTPAKAAVTFAITSRRATHTSTPNPYFINRLICLWFLSNQPLVLVGNGLKSDWFSRWTCSPLPAGRART